MTPCQINKAIDKELSSTLERLTYLLKENQRSHMMDEYPTEFVSIIQDEIIPAIESIVDYDSTPQYLYDHTGGEPPVTLTEMHEASRQQQL